MNRLPEPILTISNDRFTQFPIRYPAIQKAYETHEAMFWSAKEIDFTADLNDWNSWLPMDIKDELVEVQGVGMGCMLMKMKVFDNLQKPYFEFTYKEDTQDFFGEDFNLQKKLRVENYKIYIDTLLSKDIKHIGTFAF